MLPLNFNHFYYFYEVAKHGSFTAAARDLMVSQSSLSIQIKQLEQAMGAILFDRRRGGVDLTEAGVSAYQVAERAFQDIDQLLSQLRDAERQIHGRVSIGTVNSIGIYVLPKALSAFKDAFPDVNVKVDFTDAASVPDLVYQGKVDFGIIPWNRKYADLTSVQLAKFKMFLVAPPEHPLARKKKGFSPRDLEDYPFVGYEEGMHTRTMIDASFKRLSVAIEYVIESTNTATIKHMVLAGMGLGILPETAVGGEIRRGQLVRIELPALTMGQEIMLYYKSKRSLSPTRERFMTFMQEYFDTKTRPRGRTSKTNK